MRWLIDWSRWKARKRQRRGLFRHVVGRPGAEFSTLVGVIATGEPRQRGDRRLLHPRPTGRSPKGVVHDVERGAPGDQVEQQPGDVEEHRGPVHAEHHEHRRCGFEVRESWLLLRAAMRPSVLAGIGWFWSVPPFWYSSETSGTVRSPSLVNLAQRTVVHSPWYLAIRLLVARLLALFSTSCFIVVHSLVTFMRWLFRVYFILLFYSVTVLHFLCFSFFRCVSRFIIVKVSLDNG